MKKNEIYVDKTKDRENLRSEVEEFLANGGTIKHVTNKTMQNTLVVKSYRKIFLAHPVQDSILLVQECNYGIGYVCIFRREK